MKQNSEQANLFKRLDELSFAMDDLRLYLDTHPDCPHGLRQYEKLQEMRNQTLQTYTAEYGPIYSYDVTSGNPWTWTDGPLPWQIGGC
jgi:spore coat protein JB